jgi:hypothetical protein
MSGRIITRVRGQQAVAQQNRERRERDERQEAHERRHREAIARVIDEAFIEHCRRARSPWRRVLRAVFRP